MQCILPSVFCNKFCQQIVAFIESLTGEVIPIAFLSRFWYVVLTNHITTKERSTVMASIRKRGANLLIDNGTDVAMGRFYWDIINHLQRWISIPMLSIRTKKQQARLCKTDWISKQKPAAGQMSCRWFFSGSLLLTHYVRIITQRQAAPFLSRISSCICLKVHCSIALTAISSGPQ